MKKNKLWEVFEGKPNIQEVATESGGKKYIISGAFTMVDRPNGNNRIYPRQEMQTAIEKCRDKVKQKRIRMGLDHPSMTDWGIPKLKECAAILLDISDVKDDGYAYYTAQIVDTAVGKDLKAILDSGSPVGVSTRGYGDSVCDQEWPGLDGKFTVIKNFDLKSIDFVDDPSVASTEELMHLESTQRSEPMEIKSLEELKKAFPQFVGEMETKHTDEKKALEIKIEETAKSTEKHIATLIEAVKSVKPDAFTTVTVTETELVKEYKAKALALESELKKVVEEKTELVKKIETLEATQIKLAKDNEIAKIKGEDAAYFAHEILVKKFENCATAEEVRKVYEANKELLDSLKKAAGTPAPAKTQTPDPSKGNLTDAQKIDFNFKNSQRLSTGLPKYTEAEYIAKFVK